MVSLNIIGLNYTLSCKYINFNIEYNYIISVSYSVCTTKLTITKIFLDRRGSQPKYSESCFHTYSLKHFA